MTANLALMIFFVLAGLLALQSLVALREGQRFLQFVLKRLGETLPEYTPRVSLLVPCKGQGASFDESEVRDNLRTLLVQDYPDYEILFIVAEANDLAVPILLQLVLESKHPARVVIAGPTEGRGEKVNNLLAGMKAARRQSEVFVFVDSDGRPRGAWLRKVVAHLADPQVGAATGYRWYVSTGSLLSGLQSAWNAPAVSYLGEHKRNFCWGGSTAIRRATWEEVGVRDYWQGAVSDDFRLTEALRAARRPIVFVPQCLVPTHKEPTWRELWRWTTRQMVITRVYSPRLWRRCLGAYSLYCGTLLYGLVLAGITAATQPLLTGTILATLAGVAALGMAKGAYRLQAVVPLLPEHAEQLRRTGWSLTWLAPFVPWLYLANVLASALTRRITWAGITYKLRSPSETVVLSRK